MLTESNYFSPENQMKYMSASQFKSFSKCPAAAMAEIQGIWRRPETTALLVGSYVDSYFSGTTALFRAQHPEICKRDGCLKSDFEDANQIINRIEQDPLMMHYLSGQHQVIMTGQIAGVPFKIKIDSYSPGLWIVDQKIMRDMSSVWNSELHIRQSFVEYYSYDYAAAIYQAVEGNRLPFILAVATKETVPDIDLLEIPQEVLDDRLMMIEDQAPRFQMIKLGLEEPVRCGRCEFCRASKVLTEVKDYREVGE